MEEAKSEVARITQLLEEAGYKVLEVRDDGLHRMDVLPQGGGDPAQAYYQMIQARVAAIPQQP